MNYGEFKTQVAAYLHRSDLTTYLPTFIEYGRIRLFDQLRSADMLTRGTVTLTDGEGALSQDLVEIRTVYDASNSLPLEQVNLDEARGYSNGVYAVQGLTLVAPGYDSLEVIWYDRPLTFIGASDSATRTLLDSHPQLWLQAAVAEGYRYLDDTENEAKALSRLDTEVTAANARATRTMFGPGHRARNYYSGVGCTPPGL